MMRAVKLMAGGLVVGVLSLVGATTYLFTSIDEATSFERDTGSARDCTPQEQLVEVIADWQQADDMTREMAEAMGRANDCRVITAVPLRQQSELFGASQEALTVAEAMIDAGDVEEGLELAMDLWELQEAHAQQSKTVLGVGTTSLTGWKAAGVVGEALDTGALSNTVLEHTAERLSKLYTEPLRAVDVAAGEERAVRSFLPACVDPSALANCVSMTGQVFSWSRGLVYPADEGLEELDALHGVIDHPGHPLMHLYATVMLQRRHAQGQAAVLASGARAKLWAASHGRCPESLSVLGGSQAATPADALQFDADACTLSTESREFGAYAFTVNI